MSRRRVVVLLVLSCLLLITLDQRGSRVIDKARTGFAVVLRPFDNAAEAIARPFSTAWNGITHYSDLERENRELRDRIAQQSGAEIEYRADILEFQELLKLNRLTSAGNYKTVAARVIGDSPSNFQNSVEINKGTNDGLSTGMPVVDGAGLVGRIGTVTRDRSVVLLVTDPQYSVQAEILVSDQDIPPGGATGAPTGDSTTTVAVPATTPPPWVTAGPTTTLPLAVPPATTAPPAAPAPPAAGDSSPTTLPPETTTTTTAPPQVRRETGLLGGQGTRHPLLLDLVDEAATTNDIREGAVVKTAGGKGSLAPNGIPIGTVSRVEGQTGLRTPIVEVTPNAKLDQLYYVNVVLFVPGQGS